MFADFSGDHRNRRAVNLGGSARDRQNKEELLRKAQAERQQRELERRRTTGASRIQTFVRGRWNVRVECSELRRAFDARMAAAAAAGAAPAGVQAGTAAIQTATLLAVWNPAKDAARACALAQWIADPAAKLPDGTCISTSLAPLALGSVELAMRWKWLLVRFSERIMALLSNPPSGRKSMDAEPSAHPTSAAGLEAATAALVMQIFDERTSTGVASLDKETLAAIREQIVRRGLFRLARCLIESAPVSLSPTRRPSPPAQSATQLIVSPLALSAQNNILASAVLEQLFLNILTIRNLSERIPSPLWTALSLFLRSSKAAEGVSSMFASVATQIADQDSIVAVIENFIDAFKPVLESASQPRGSVVVSDNITLLPSSGLANQPPKIHFVASVQSMLSALDVSLFVQFDKDARQRAGDDATQAIRPSTPSTNHRLATLVARLANRSHIATVMNSCSAAEYLPTAIAYLVTVSVLCPSRRDDIFNGLLFSRHAQLSKRLWTELKQSRLFKELRRLPADASLPDGPEFAVDWSMLTIFGEMFTRELLAVGDDELFGPNFPLTKQDLVELSALSKGISISFCWRSLVSAATSVSPQLSTDYVSDIFVRLTQQLHARDARKRFCPPDHWLMDESFGGYNFVDMILQPQPMGLIAGSFGPRSNRAAVCQAILSTIPFTVPFESRVQILRSWISEEKNNDQRMHFEPVARANIRRGSVFEDGFETLNRLGPNLKHRVAISFIDEHGLPEAGIDGGGVFKEFLSSCLKQAFDPNYGLFVTTKDQLLYPSPTEHAVEDAQLALMEFLGRIIGKALYEGVLIEAGFANFFLAKWLGKRSYLDDLPSLDSELYNGLIYLKNYDGDVEKDLSLNFTVSESEFGVHKTVELVPNGANIPVTNDNRIRYIYLTANYKLNTKISQQCRAFFRGLSDLVHPQWLKMFDEPELQILLGGNAEPIDLADLRRNTVYSGVYDDDHPTIKMFWRVVESFDEEHRRKLIRFITSCSRPPLLGFSYLQPLLSIRDSGNDEERLPTASTCVNLLKLPIYKSEAILHSKLRYAISVDAGFELS
ncbi:ubiquitin-protein ligase (E3) [Polyrhizophydium stewartii]|uniref:HECT-type E3 ubiquitin transferase n=1 Tax=Polyrhizophydium stewartii TaxID=2732419 RepID=A0ABR4N1G9_9FUNG